MRKFVSLLVLTALACNLTNLAAVKRATPTIPNQSIIPSDPPTAVAASTPGSTPLPAPPQGVWNAYRQKLDAGDWSQEAGLVASLRYLVNEQDAATAFGDTALFGAEATPFLTSAIQLLESGQELNNRSELERLVNLLQPPLDLLDKHSRPGKINSLTLHEKTAHLSKPARTAEECQNLWITGFKDGSALVCFEYVTVNVGTTRLSIYFPAFWSTSDPRRAYLSLAAEAMQDSAKIYNAYRGDMQSVRLVFTELGSSTSSPKKDPTIWAAAAQDKGDSGCMVGVYPYATSQGADDFKQAIAHEMFHCFQISFLYPQAYKVKSSYNDWWVESSADFFSNLVYPTTNYEWGNLPAFDVNMKSNNLFHGSYENSAFFQFLANNAGISIPVIVDLLESMPKSGGFAEQQAALAAFPDIANLWHKFGKEYIDAKIIDTSAEALPLSPSPNAYFSYGLGPKKDTFTVKPFMITRPLLVFEKENKFSLAASASGAGQHSMRPGWAPGEWSSPPAEIFSGCDSSPYLLLLTSAAAGDVTYNLDLSVNGESSPGCDRCLVGKWLLENDSALNYIQSILDGAGGAKVEVQSVTGAGFMEVLSSGLTMQGYDDLKLSAVAHQKSQSGSDMAFNFDYLYSGKVHYSLHPNPKIGELGYSNVSGKLVLEVFMNGSSLGSQGPALPGGDVGVTTRYTCKDNLLTMQSLDIPTNAVLRYQRVVEKK